MLVATVHSIPNANYQVLGLVSCAVKSTFFAKPEQAIERIQKEAQRLYPGANGVIGIQIVTGSSWSITGRNRTTWAIGTAIRLA